MAVRTYTYVASNIIEPGKDRMRFELGDTMVEGKAETCALTDEEIICALEMKKYNWKQAKLALLESICRRLAYEVDTTTGPLSLAFSGRAKLWREDYEQLKKEVKTESITVPPSSFGSDGNGKPPYFYTGMMHNHNACRGVEDEKLYVPKAR